MDSGDAWRIGIPIIILQLAVGPEAIPLLVILPTAGVALIQKLLLLRRRNLLLEMVVVVELVVLIPPLRIIIPTTSLSPSILPRIDRATIPPITTVPA